jgi:hypothetical protein
LANSQGYSQSTVANTARVTSTGSDSPNTRYAGHVGGPPYRSGMRSINGSVRIGSVLDHLDAALSRGATFLELMELLDSYKRLSRELAALEYESTSPFGRPW